MNQKHDTGRKEKMKNDSQELVLPHSHSICHVQHTSLLCFMTCFNYYIPINIDMKTTAKSIPVFVKVSVLQQGLKVRICAWYVPICQVPYIWYKTSAPWHLPAVQPEPHAIKPGSCSKAPCHSQSQNQARGPCITTEERHHLHLCSTGVNTMEGS